MILKSPFNNSQKLSEKPTERRDSEMNRKEENRKTMERKPKAIKSWYSRTVLLRDRCCKTFWRNKQSHNLQQDFDERFDECAPLRIGVFSYR